MNLLSADYLAIHLIDARFCSMIAIITSKRDIVEIKFVLNRFQLLIEFICLLHGLFNDGIDIGFHIHILIVAGKNDLLGTMLNHIEYLFGAHLVGSL
jgi:hypothetical protein